MREWSGKWSSGVRRCGIKEEWEDSERVRNWWVREWL